MTNRLTWEPGKGGSLDGYIYGEAEKYKAKMLVFAIYFSPGIDAGGPWLIAHRLPFRGIERRFGTAKLAQEHAERYLVWAFRLMGFVPDDKEDDGT